MAREDHDLDHHFDFAMGRFIKGKSPKITATRVIEVGEYGVRLETLGGVYVLRKDGSAAVVKTRTRRAGFATSNQTTYTQELVESGAARVKRQFTTALLAAYYMTEVRGESK